jgi:hypothetical protein
LELTPVSELVVDPREVRLWRRIVDSGAPLTAPVPGPTLDQPVIVTALSVPAEIVISPLDGSVSDRPSDVLR